MPPTPNCPMSERTLSHLTHLGRSAGQVTSGSGSGRSTVGQEEILPDIVSVDRLRAPADFYVLTVQDIWIFRNMGCQAPLNQCSTRPDVGREGLNTFFRGRYRHMCQKFVRFVVTSSLPLRKFSAPSLNGSDLNS